MLTDIFKLLVFITFEIKDSSRKRVELAFLADSLTVNALFDIYLLIRLLLIRPGF
jgi:hypothetical protein